MRFVILAVFLVGCAVGPNYRAPRNDVTDVWHTAEVDNSQLIVAWWKQFDDPLLSKYVELAAAYNYSLKVAEANILEARGLRMIRRAPLFPHVNADFNGQRLHFSKNGLFPFTPSTQSLYNFFFDATWEIDLFGKTRRAVEAADAQIEASIHQRDDVLITIIAELVRNYVELRGFQKQEGLISENIALLEKKAAIVEKQLEYGYVNRAAYDNVLVDLGFVKAALPLIKAQIYQNIYRISILTGALPETLSGELETGGPLPKIPEKIAVGLRSDLLRRRPDIRKAEREFAAATAEIGVAVASFFPSVTLNAIPGFQSKEIKDFFNSKSGMWALGGNVNLPIFEGGKLMGNLKVTKARAQAAISEYHEVVLKALEEAESALAAYTDTLTTVKELDLRNTKNVDVVDISRKQYLAGYASLLTLINNERQLNSSEQYLVDGQLLALINLVALYKALGGGFDGVELGCP